MKNKRKKGFTLIELLAVILILGIIALIAIPTVNNIINESRLGAFKTTINQLSASIENNCQMEIMKNTEFNNIYEITDGVLSPSVDIKGELPSSGYFMVNNNCELKFYTENGKFIAKKSKFDNEIEFKKCENGECEISEEMLYEKIKLQVKQAFLRWLSNKQEYLPKNRNAIYISLSYLKYLGYLPADFKNPISGKCIDASQYVALTNVDGKYEIGVNIDSQNNGDYYCKNSNFERSLLLIGYPAFSFEIPQNSTFNHIGFVSFNAENDQKEDNSVVTVEYYNPSNVQVPSFDTSIKGKWTITYTFSEVKSDYMMAPLTVITRTVTVK